MFNEKLKTDFINSFTESEDYRSLCKGIFNATAAAEYDKGVDICTMSASELNPIVSDIVGLRSSGHESKMKILRSYFRYCLKTGYPGAGLAIDHVVIDTVYKFKNEMVSGPYELQEWLNSVFEPEKYQTIANVYRCYFWFAFSGMDEAEIFTLKKDNIDLIRGIATVGTQEYQLYKEAYPAIKNAMDLTAFNYRHGNYKEDVFKDRLPGDLIMRFILTQKASESSQSRESMQQTMRVAVSRAQKDAISKNGDIKKLSYSHVRLSGVFYRKYERERARKWPFEWDNFVSDAKDLMRTNVDNTNKNTKYSQNKIARTLFKDYQKWKAAFAV